MKDSMPSSDGDHPESHVLCSGEFGKKNVIVDEDSNNESEREFPDFVAYHFLNGFGELRAMEEDGAKTSKLLGDGLSVDGSSILGGGGGESFLAAAGGTKVEHSDLKLIAEPDTYAVIRIAGVGKEGQDDDFVQHRFWAHAMAVDEETKKETPYPLDPRNILQKQVDKARSLGYEPYMFSEIEFYLVDATTGKPIDDATYCSLPPDDASWKFRRDLGRLCKASGVSVKRLHHENGGSQNELELNLSPTLKNADDTVLTLWLMKMLASQKRYNYRILFGPKPFEGKAGNGLHHHIMLRDVKTQRNVFQALDVPDEQCLSELARRGIAGLLEYADDITAVFASSAESFERLQPGYEAPVYKAWGYANRTALVRVPGNTGPDGTRFEYRGGDLSSADCGVKGSVVHLFGAVLLAAVLRGITDELVAPPPADVDIESLSEKEREKRGLKAVPLSLKECHRVLKHSELLRDVLGPEMIRLLLHRNELSMYASTQHLTYDVGIADPAAHSPPSHPHTVTSASSDAHSASSVFGAFDYIARFIFHH